MKVKTINLSTSILFSLGAMLIMMGMYYLTQAGLMGSNPVGQSSNFESPLIVPAGYAFAIWSIIYIGIIAFPIYQFFIRREGHPLWKQVHVWYALNVICNGLWLICASYDWQLICLGVIAIMLLTLYKINELLIAIDKEYPDLNYWLERMVFSIYFAWITLATALNVSTVLAFYKWDGWGISELTWAIIILPVVSLVAGTVFWKYRDAAYASVVVWAFIALIVKHINDSMILTGISGAVVVIFLGLIFTKSRKVLSNA